MHIKYSKKRLNFSLIFGSIWLVIFAIYMALGSLSYLRYGYLILGVILIISHFYEKTKHYLTIKNGIIAKHQLFSKTIEIDKITDVRYFAGEYKLLTSTSQMTINTALIDKQSLEDLKRALETIKSQLP